MSEQATEQRPAEAARDAWIDKYCVCETCSHNIDHDLFGYTFCDRSDSMAGGWNPPGSLCEEHYFEDRTLQAEMDRLMDAWYEEAKAHGDFPT